MLEQVSFKTRHYLDYSGVEQLAIIRSREDLIVLIGFGREKRSNAYLRLGYF